MMHVRWVRDLSRGFLIKQGKTKFIPDPDRRDEWLMKLADTIETLRARLLLILDPVAVGYISEKKPSLDLLRGSVYFVDDIPAVVLDSLRTSGGAPKLRAVNHAGWLLKKDLQKALRWYQGTPKREPRFDLTIVDDASKFKEFEDVAHQATLIGMDTETSGTGATASITCSGYACSLPSGRVQTFVVPFLWPVGETGTTWSVAEWGTLFPILRAIHANRAVKILQNGSYDANYYIKYRLPVANWYLDTAVAFHAIWAEIPKRIDFIASVACDHYRYWKDEGKADDKDDNKTGAIPRTSLGWARYLQYNGLDCHYLVPIATWALAILTNVPWAMANYRSDMRQILGPAMAMSMRGLPVNETIRDRWAMKEAGASHEALAILHRMVGVPDFNPNSPAQVGTLIYDILQAEPLKKGKGPKAKPQRTTDEKILEIIRTQHPLLDIIIKQIWATKKPANNIAKYGPAYRAEDGKWKGMRLLNGRWMYKLNPIGTETARYSSKKHDFWIGQQVQNPPYEARAMVNADEGYYLWRADLSKADFFHTAYASEEPNMIHVVEQEVAGKLDAHCYHAARYFARDYEEVYNGYKNKEDWVVHSTRGCRQNTKRIVYGANYLMGGYTLYVTIMGKEAMDATALSMGRAIGAWQLNDYARFGDELINLYYSELYPGLMPWLERTAHFVSTHGQVATCAGGRTRFFFGDVLKDAAAQRELAAYFGQAGTAGTINRVLDDLYYNGFDSDEISLHWQLHDEIGGMVRHDQLHKLAELKQRMEIENEINGRKFRIPVEIEVGKGWGYRMCGWHPDITHEEIHEANEKWLCKQNQ